MTGAIERLTRWRKVTLDDETHAASSRPADPEAPFSGEWWSTPALTPLVSTTRPLPQIGSIQLVWQEDSLGFDDASIWSVDPIRPARILEIDGPEAWVSLVERHPIDVTHARLHDWYRTTGRVGAWRIPDWRAVAARWDAVHVTVAGYLTTETRALPMAGGSAATMLAGWNPDQTWWLTDILRTARPEPDRWHQAPDSSGPGRGWHLRRG